MIDAYPRSGPGSTRELTNALAELPPLAALAGYGGFPVAGLATWSDDWLYPRQIPTFHVHEGTDVFAARGTYVVSPTTGRVHVSEGGIGGLSVKVTQKDTTYWYLAHLDQVLIDDGAEVTPGTIVGIVGDTGNAKGGAPHVHVEVHPGGGRAADPKALLDHLYDTALANVGRVLQAFSARELVRADRIEPARPRVVVPKAKPTPTVMRIQNAVERELRRLRRDDLVARRAERAGVSWPPDQVSD